MLRRLAWIAVSLALVAALAAGALVWATAPDDAAIALPAHEPDLANGEVMFLAGGCLSCHEPAEGSGIDAALPAGGAPLATPIGQVTPPNITPDEETGIGRWSTEDFVRAMTRGAAPDGRHYIPAFPYTSYRHMKVADLIDLHGYLETLEPVSNAVETGNLLVALGRPFTGIWKLAGMTPLAVPPDPARGAEWNRGAYLVQGPGHCGECHTKRNLFMAMRPGKFLDGAKHPEGEGKVPRLTRLIERGDYKDVDDLTAALRFGELFGYDGLSSGGMGDVQENLGRLPESDARAIAVFLASLHD